MITATNNPYPEEPDASPTKLDRGGYEGNAETLDEKITANLTEVKALIETYKGSKDLGSITPTSVPSTNPADLGPAFWRATQNGTYTYFGGFVVPANNFAIFSRDVNGVFSVSMTALDISSKVNVSDVKDNLISTDANKPLSANQGKLLNEKLIEKPDLVIGKNKFNKDTAVIGYFLGNDNIQAVSAPYDYSDFIPVIPNQEYKSNFNMRFTTYFGVNKTLISGGSAGNVTSFVIPNNVYFIKITIYHTNFNTFQLELGSVATTYEAYKKTVPSSQIDLSLYTKTSEIGIAVSPLIEKKANLVFGKNLFDKSKTTDGYYLNTTNGALIASASISVSDFIVISPNTQYFFNTNRLYTCFYTIDKVYISGTLGAFPLTSPSNAYFIRVSLTTSQINTMQLEAGAVATAYVPFSFSIPFNELPEIASNWKGTETATIGDSITQLNSWQPYLLQKLGLTINNLGVGGTMLSGTSTSSMNNDVRLNAINSTTKLILVLGGTNDWAQNVVLGSETSTDVNTFNGALNVTIEKLSKRFSGTKKITTLTLTGTSGTASITLAGKLTKTVTFSTSLTQTATDFVTAFASDYLAADIVLTSSGASLIFTANTIGFTNPVITNVTTNLSGTIVNTQLTANPATILFLTTPYGELYSFEARGWTNSFTNTQGLTTIDYAQAVRNRCLFWGIPYVDLNDCGINKTNIRAFMIDDGGLLHPNDDGGKRIARAVIGKLKSIDKL